MNKTNEFIKLISKLEPIEFIGIARILCVDIMDEANKTPRDFEDILSDVVVKFNSLARKQRRDILKVLRKVEKENVTTKN